MTDEERNFIECFPELKERPAAEVFEILAREFPQNWAERKEE